MNNGSGNIAQMVERSPDKADVNGSSPFIPTTLWECNSTG